MRVGIGYDAHRLVEGRRLILGGVEIPFEKGLLGHSDADVLVHAIADALLGAIGAGDIGSHFPDGDEAYKDISSIKILERVVAMVDDAAFHVVNVDAVVVAQRPKLACYSGQMKANIAPILGVDEHQVGIKFTTEEHMGFTGRGEGIAAHAVCLLWRAGE